LTQRQLAERTGIKQPLISELEHDKRPKIALAIVNTLAEALGVTLDWLVHGTDDSEGVLSMAALLDTRPAMERVVAIS
jgi:transcriptional regulator with XRE-family HTH domain